MLLFSPWITLLSSLLPVPVSAFSTLLLAYILFEIGFFFHYHLVLLPEANRIDTSRPPAPYRDYPDVEDRVKLLKRIIQRLGKRVSKDEDSHYEQFSKQFDMAALDGGFCPPPPPMLRMAWASSVDKSSSTSDGLNESSSESSLMLNESSNEDAYGRRNQMNDNKLNQNKKIEESSNSNKLRKDNMDEFLSWAFFGVHHSTVQSSPSMQKALDDFYQILESESGLTFESGRSFNYTPRCFSFEEVNSLYRPYCVYAGVALLRFTANCILRAMGFRKYTCERGLRYWHRPAPTSNKVESPFLFFHGIAPGGHAPYLPMIFLGLLRGSSLNRDIFFFENKPVSYALCFDAVSEEDTVHGVLEAINRHLHSHRQAKDLSLCGHSLGSCQLTLLIQSPQLRHRIRNLILIDPVSILLSEPDVMINFLYTRRESEDDDDNLNGWTHRLIRLVHESKIHLVASSELFIEHYLRRNFAWYNSELWLADIPHDVNVLVCLSEHDEIVNSPKVEREIDEHNNHVISQKDTTSPAAMVEKIMWKGVGHAHCITHPDKWAHVHRAMGRMK
ncbi:hypothetical protein HJC23_013485 [Cyclotella cryptica]|uniref:AB hydrolase-1 domain-containing protein n=1 Tax=Cyclotella cryptica TaxID=29204 RepID=A0ABD3QBZ0_9STRA